MNTINKLFAVQVKKNPDALAIIDRDILLTYAELNRRTNQLARFLKEKGVRPETQVAIAMERNADVLIGMLAVLKAGGAYVPLDYTSPEERLLLMLNEHNTPFLLTHTRHKAQFQRYQGELIAIENPQNYSNFSDKNIKNSVTGDNLAYIIYTSGSTGMPKGVMLEHHTVVNFTLYFKQFCTNNPIKRIDFSSNYAFDMAVSNTITALMLGLTIVIADDGTKLDAARYFKFLNDHKINCIKITPSYFKLLLYATESHFIPLNHLKLIVLGGENLSTLDCATWHALYPHHQLLNEYGPTEATVAVSYYAFSNTSSFACRPNVPIGMPSAHVAFCLLNEKQKPVKSGEFGELYIGGDCLARGYLNQTALTDKSFIWLKLRNKKTERFYKTGDLCQEIAPNTFDYLGRIDHQVKIRGFRIELGEIEHYLHKHPAIQQAVVIAEMGPSNEKQLIAYYVMRQDDAHLAVKELKTYLQGYLIDAMIPSFFIKLPVIPMNANGKLDRKQLPLPEQESVAISRPPKGRIEKTLVEIWMKELSCSGLSIEDNFFELGGHSLVAARIITQIKNQLKKEISIKELYKAPTIITLARRVKRAKQTEENPEFFARAEALPLGDFQLLIWLSNLFDKSVSKINVVTCKRYKGTLNAEILNQSLSLLINAYPLLSYKIYKTRPLQKYHAIKHVNFSVHDLNGLSQEDKNKAINASVKQMQQFKWKRAKSLVALQVILLNKEEFEIQLALPHIIADGHTGDIIFNQLSMIYDYLKNGKSLEMRQDDAFINYLMAEKNASFEGLVHDQQFWQRYLSTAQLVFFDSAHIVSNKPGFIYSSYIKLSNAVMQNLDHLIFEQHANINAVLSAATALVLSRYIQPLESSNQILINLVKSTRDNPIYDQSIGCFLRVEPIKINPLITDTVASLSRKIEQEMVNTEPHQRALGFLKLAAVHNPKKINRFKQRAIESLMRCYSKLFPSLNITEPYIEACAKLATFKERQGFMVNINLWSNFFQKKADKQEIGYFDSLMVPRPLIQEELLTIDYVLDVCFLRDDSNLPYLVISANLESDLREKLAYDILGLLTDTISVLS